MRDPQRCIAINVALEVGGVQFNIFVVVEDDCMHYGKVSRLAAIQRLSVLPKIHDAMIAENLPKSSCDIPANLNFQIESSNPINLIVANKEVNPVKKGAPKNAQGDFSKIPRQLN